MNDDLERHKIIHPSIHPPTNLEGLNVSARCWATEVKTVMDGIPALMEILTLEM